MKGLLRKDFYMAAKYCRSYLLIGIAFLALSFTGGGQTEPVFCVLPLSALRHGSGEPAGL